MSFKLILSNKAISYLLNNTSMSKLQLASNPEVEIVFNNYSALAKEKVLNLRRIILETAEEIEGLNTMEETLKWGEPSYLAKKGSTIRIDWKKNKPGQYAMYFKCTSKLVSTFRLFFEDIFKFEGSRAIVFNLDEKVPEKELKKCIKAALTYHKVKKLPTLGI